MPIFIGVDGGGTKTSCLVGDESSVLGGADAGPANVVRVGESAARDALTEAILGACSVAKIDPKDITRTVIGAAGASVGEVARSLRRIVAEVVGGEVEIVSDMVIALHAAFGTKSGVIVIAGTGSGAYGRNDAGETATAGGWGYAVSDEGSGHWIGQAGVKAAFRAWDETGGRENLLLEEIMKAWNVETRDGLILAANSSSAPNFAALFPAVLEAAQSGDPYAKDVLSRAGHELARLGKMVVQRLFPHEFLVPVAMIGGVFANSAAVRNSFRENIISECKAVISENLVEPVQGALALARQGGQ